MSDHELLDILDEAGNVIATVTRAEAEQDNHMTQNVLVFLFNSDGKVWAQLRPMSKKHYPGKWDISACGGVVSTEPHELSAARETEEETGLRPELHYVETFLNVFPGDNGEERRRLSHLYFGLTDETPAENEEVDEFRLWDVDELFADIAAHPDNYIPSFEVELQKAVKAYRSTTR